MLSKRMDVISESLTLKLNARVGELKAAGEDIVNLTAGESDFLPPEEVKAAAKEAIDQNLAKYAPVPGYPELRQAVADKTNAQQPSLKAPWEAANVIVSNGGKQSLFNACLALLDPGDEVLIPTPFWLSYPEMVKLGGGTPKLVQSSFENGFKLTPSELKAAITPKTKMILFNSPSNPSGVMYSKNELRALGDVIASSSDRAFVVSDEIYDRIILDDVPFCSFGEAAPDLAARTLTVNGMSKFAAITGWRVGWTVGPKNVIQAMTKLQGQSTSGVCGPMQKAAVAGLKIAESVFLSQSETFRKRRDLVFQILNKSKKIKKIPPLGAFYAFVGIEDCLKDGEDSVTFAERFLNEKKVAVVPGTPFGESTFIRMSFATDERSLQEGCDRLVQFVEGLP